MSILVTDNFNRANADPISGSWTNAGDAGTFTISANAAGVSQTALDSSDFNNSITWPNDQYSQAQVTVTGTVGADSGIGPSVRMATGQNYYRLVVDHAATSNVSLGRVSAGTFFPIWQRTQAFTDGDTFRLEVQGSTLTARYKGTAIGAGVTDSNITSGSAGMIYSSTETAPSLDNWEGGDLQVLQSPSSPWPQRGQFGSLLAQ